MTEDQPVVVERGRLTENGTVVPPPGPPTRSLAETRATRRDSMRGWLENWMYRVFGGGPL